MTLHRKLRASWIGACGLIGAGLLVMTACGGGDEATKPAPTPTSRPTAAATPTPTPAPQQTPAATATASPRYGGTISWAWCCPDLTHLDPNLGTNTMASQSLGAAYNRLTKTVRNQTPNDVTIAPDLAESYQISGDGLTITFKLRQGVRFHNVAPTAGRELTSEDVKWSLERVAFGAESGFKATYKDVKSIEAPNPSTVTISLQRYNAMMLFQMSGREAYIAAKDAGEAGLLKTTVVGTGPFVFDRWDKGVGVFFKKNPNYFKKGLPYVDNFESLVIPDRATRTAALTSGKLTYMEYILKDERDQVIKSNPAWGNEKYLWASAYAVMMKSTHPLFKDVRVRRAISLGINFDNHIGVAFGGDGIIAGPISGQHGPWALTPAELKSNKFYKRYDVAEAKRLLSEAGVAPGTKVAFEYVTYQRDYSSQAELLLSEFKAIGLEPVGNQVGDFLTFRSRQDKGEYSDITFGFDAQGNPLQWLVGNYRSGGAKNGMQLKDPEVDAAIDKIVATADVAEQMRLAKALQEKLEEQVMYKIRIADSNAYTIWQPKLKGFANSPSHPIEVYVRDHESFWLDQ